MRKIFFCFAALIFSSCTNFFEGSDLKNQLDEMIEISQERPVTLSIVKYNPNAFISLSPEGNMQYKRNQEFKIEAILKSDYSFIEWRIVDKRNGLLAENADDYIRLINPTHTETANGSISTVNVKIIKTTEEDFLQIVPVCSIKTDTKAPVFSGSFVCANSLEKFK